MQKTQKTQKNKKQNPRQEVLTKGLQCTSIEKGTTTYMYICTYTVYVYS